MGTTSRGAARGRGAGDAGGVRAWLAGLPPATRRPVEELRRLVRRVAPEAVESLAWGSLSYHRPAVGGRVKGSLCLITAKRGELRLEFVHGARLPDPDGLLRGAGAAKRHVTIDPARPLPRRELAELVREAAQVAW